MVINAELLINEDEITDSKTVTVTKSLDKNNGTGDFEIFFDSPYGRHATDFAINQEVSVSADIDASPTTKIFTGTIENIEFRGNGNKENLVVTGRDFGSILQKRIVQPRIFKDTEVSEIVLAVMQQNVGESITTNNVNVTDTTIEKFTISNKNVYDVLSELAISAKFVFFVDPDKDLNFIESAGEDSGLTFDSTNILRSRTRNHGTDIFNRVTVYGSRQLTALKEEFVTGTDNSGSVYILDQKPSNTAVFISGTTPTFLQPGGILGISDPAREPVKYLVDFQGQSIVLTSGVAAGDNIQANGSVVIVDYQGESPVIGFREDLPSQALYQIQDKNIIDKNIKDPEEATGRARDFLQSNKDPKTETNVNLKGVLHVNLGDSAILNIPNFNLNNQTVEIQNATYTFSTANNLNEEVLSLDLDKI